MRYTILNNGSIVVGSLVSDILQNGPDKIRDDEGIGKIGQKHENGFFIDVEAALSPKTILTHHEFRSRFTFDEKIAIETSTDGGVIVVRKDMEAAQEIDLDNQELKDGMIYIVSKVPELTDSRRIEIMTPEMV